MDEPSEILPPSLLWLKRLVIVLTVVMIVGMVLLVGTLMVKLRSAPLPLPDSLVLPDGTRPNAVSYTERHIIVVSDDQLLVYDRPTGDLAQTVDLK